MEEINELFSEAKKRAKANGVADQEAWDGIIDEVVEEFRTNGNIDDDGDTEGMEEELRARFGEYEESVKEEGFDL